MESLQNIKSRRTAVKNISQITKAMEVVAATKMRRSQETALSSRPYGITSLAILRDLANQMPDVLASCPLFVRREVKTTLVVMVASDQGLAGAFNSQVMKALDTFFAADKMNGVDGHGYKVIAVGKKLFSFAAKKNLDVVKSFSKFGNYAQPEQIRPIAEAAVKGFVSGSWDRVVIVSTHFRTTLKQETVTRELLPLDPDHLSETLEEIIPEHGKFSELRSLITSNEGRNLNEYLFEPTPEIVVNTLASHLVTMQIYQLVLESNASEHSARMVAMKSASDNAVELTSSLSLIYNKARQAGITKEMTEISAALATL
jgi:F-type H+-transporting ATPase subunit gamma